jgi:ribosome-binding factor A
MTQDEQEPSEQENSEGSAKVSPEFQEQVTQLIGTATLPELEFIDSEVVDMMKKLQSSQKKSGLATDKFSTEGMPQD